MQPPSESSTNHLQPYKNVPNMCLDNPFETVWQRDVSSHWLPDSVQVRKTFCVNIGAEANRNTKLGRVLFCLRNKLKFFRKPGFQAVQSCLLAKAACSNAMGIAARGDESPASAASRQIRSVQVRKRFCFDIDFFQVATEHTVLEWNLETCGTKAIFPKTRTPRLTDLLANKASRLCELKRSLMHASNRA